MAENTAVAEKKAFTTSLSEWSNTITGLGYDKQDNELIFFDSKSICHYI